MNQTAHKFRKRTNQHQSQSLRCWWSSFCLYKLIINRTWTSSNTLLLLRQTDCGSLSRTVSSCVSPSSSWPLITSRTDPSEQRTGEDEPASILNLRRCSSPWQQAHVQWTTRMHFSVAGAFGFHIKPQTHDSAETNTSSPALSADGPNPQQRPGHPFPSWLGPASTNNMLELHRWRSCSEIRLLYDTTASRSLQRQREREWCSGGFACWRITLFTEWRHTADEPIRERRDRAVNK